MFPLYIYLPLNWSYYLPYLPIPTYRATYLGWRFGAKKPQNQNFPPTRNYGLICRSCQ